MAFYTAIGQGRRYIPYNQEKSTVEIKSGNVPPVKGEAKKGNAQPMQRVQNPHPKKIPPITHSVKSTSAQPNIRSARESPPSNSLANLARALQQFNKSILLVLCNKERIHTITGCSVYLISLYSFAH